MKKIVSLLLALSLIFVMFAMVACSDDTNGDDTDGKGTTAAPGKGTEAPDKGTEAPDKGTEPAGTDASTEGGDPDDDSDTPDSVKGSGMDAVEGAVYFEIADENVIHDGKGTWSNKEEYLPTMVFDGDTATFYDCDEKDGRGNNTEAMNVGIPYEGEEEFPTGYVGAYFADGITVKEVRVAGRWYPDDWLSRMVGGTIEASADGENWDLLGTIEEAGGPGEYVCIEIPEEFQSTVYKYVRYVGPVDGYCNISEFEIWGNPAA